MYWHHRVIDPIVCSIPLLIEAAVSPIVRINHQHPCHKIMTWMYLEETKGEAKQLIKLLKLWTTIARKMMRFCDPCANYK